MGSMESYTRKALVFADTGDEKKVEPGLVCDRVVDGDRIPGSQTGEGGAQGRGHFQLDH